MATFLRAAPLVSGLFLSTLAFGQTGPAGRWEGSMQLPDRELPITVDLAKDDKGVWTGSLSSTQNAQNVPLADIKADDKSVKFRFGIGGSNSPDFDCSLPAPGSMKCTVTSPGGSVAASMKRTGEAKVELPKASPAVSTELEGNWEGSLETPNGTLRIVAHFKNQDKTVKATMDSPDQGAMDLPLTDIVQNGTAVEFHLKVVGGGFKGNLNGAATQLVGEWSQSGATLPLTFKKSAAK